MNMVQVGQVNRASAPISVGWTRRYTRSSEWRRHLNVCGARHSWKRASSWTRRTAALWLPAGWPESPSHHFGLAQRPGTGKRSEPWRPIDVRDAVTLSRMPETLSVETREPRGLATAAA